MKLTIDTKADSKDEIKKAIRLLSAIVGGREGIYTNKPEKPAVANIFESSSNTLDQNSQEKEPSGNPFAAMFGGSATETTEDNYDEDKEEEPDETPQIQLY